MRQLARSVFMFFALLAPVSFAEAATGWTQLSNTAIRTVCPNPNPGGNCEWVMGAWSGGIADTTRNRLIVWGGGHGDYGGNEIYAITLQPPSVARITNQSTPAGSGSPESLSDGNPSSRHTYDGLAYITHADRLFSFGGSVAPGGNCTSGTWTFRFDTLAWQQMSPSGASLNGTCGAISAYDPNTQKVYVMDRGATFNFVSYTLETNSYQLLSTNGGFPLYKTAAIDTKRKLFVIMGGGGAFKIDISTGSSYALQTLSLTGDLTPVNAAGLGLAYDPIGDRMIAYTGAGNTIYSINLDTNVSTAVTFTGGPGAASAGHAPDSNALFGRFEYFPFLGVFATVNDVDNNVLTLRVNEFAGGLPMPSAQNERDTYTALGWTFNAGNEPNFPANPSFSVSDPDVHGDMEADDLWNNVQAYRRWVQLGYRDRMLGWARYFKDDFNQCVGTSGLTLCSDESSFNLDHLFGWGLVDYFLLTGSNAHLTAAENLAARSETFWNNHPSCPGPSCTGTKPTPGVFSVIGTGHRRIARHLLLLTRLAEVTQLARWITHRDYLISLLLQSPDWNAQYGFYYLQESTTNVVVTCQANAYANGARITNSFMMAGLVEALHHVWRTTGNTTARTKIISMANFVNTYGMHPTYNLAAQYYGIVNGQAWYQPTDGPGNCNLPTATWGGPYTTSLVNSLVYGYKLTGTTTLLTKARQALGCGMRAAATGEANPCTLSASNVTHFVDSLVSSDPIYFAFNKGELQYTYRIFENGGNPTVEGGGNPPTAPTNFRIQ